jgi:hypothetical protein
MHYLGQKTGGKALTYKNGKVDATDEAKDIIKNRRVDAAGEVGGFRKRLTDTLDATKTGKSSSKNLTKGEKKTGAEIHKSMADFNQGNAAMDQFEKEYKAVGKAAQKKYVDSHLKPTMGKFRRLLVNIGGKNAARLARNEYELQHQQEYRDASNLANQGNKGVYRGVNDANNTLGHNQLVPDGKGGFKTAKAGMDTAKEAIARNTDT